MEQIVYQAGFGLFAGGLISATGYLKSYHPEGNHVGFDIFKFVKTAVLGGVVGGAAAFMGITPEVFIALPVYAGVETAIENVLKAILRKFSKKT